MFSFTADGAQSAEAAQTINTVVLQDVVSAGCHPDTDVNVTRIAIIQQTIFPKLWVTLPTPKFAYFRQRMNLLWYLIQAVTAAAVCMFTPSPNKSVISLHRASKITLVNKGLASLEKNKFERAEHRFYGWSWASLASGYCNSFAFSCILNMK